MTVPNNRIANLAGLQRLFYTGRYKYPPETELVLCIHLTLSSEEPRSKSTKLVSMQLGRSECELREDFRFGTCIN